ncbi:arylsulfatase B isoform X2 [Agrilus planipennis]|nr:arylsulfatase B isoform X2 [Agrilus planipennis]
MQHLVILEPEPWGLPLNETLLPQHLKRNGYATHAIGKWHLGFFKKEYTPTYRGFDTHFGYWQGLQDYYQHTVHATYGDEYGYDMRRNMTVDWSAQGKYSTDLFTSEAIKLIKEHDSNQPMFMYFAHLAPHSGNDDNPLQAPDEEIAKFGYIADPERRIYAAMVSLLDQSIGKVVTALREKHMLENSIILFMSDNGAQPEGIHANHGSNYPLRGVKNSPWEGGNRCVAAVWSPLIKKPQRVSNKLMHISDWLPTFYSAAGLNKTELGDIDGIDMWQAISEDAPGSRTEMLYNIDPVYSYASIRKGDWKYINGSTSKKNDGWKGSSGRSELYKYDEKSVLSSKVAVAVAGMITSKQIQEKYSNDQHKVNESASTFKFLDSNVISQIRKEATVNCGHPNIEEMQDKHICDPFVSPCLFNLKDDPCERINLAADKQSTMINLEMLLQQYKRGAVDPINVPADPLANPNLYNNTWVNWKDYEVTKKKISYKVLSPLAIGLISAACVAFLIVIVTLLAFTTKKAKSINGSIYNEYEQGNCEENIVDDDIKIKCNDQAFEHKEKLKTGSFKEPLKIIE